MGRRLADISGVWPAAADTRRSGGLQTRRAHLSARWWLFTAATTRIRPRASRNHYPGIELIAGSSCSKIVATNHGPNGEPGTSSTEY